MRREPPLHPSIVEIEDVYPPDDEPFAPASRPTWIERARILRRTPTVRPLDDQFKGARFPDAREGTAIVPWCSRDRLPQERGVRHRAHLVSSHGGRDFVKMAFLERDKHIPAGLERT